MLKVLKLDWCAIKSYRIRLLLVPVTLLVIGGMSSICLVPMSVFLLFSFSVNCFLVEEKGALNRLYLTLPIERSRIVTGRYLLSLLLFVASLFTGFALMPVANLFALSRWYPDWRWNMALASFAFLIYALMSLSMYPVLFRLGYLKGKIWGFYIPTILVGLIYLAIVEYDAVAGGFFITNLLLYASENILVVSGGMLTLGAMLLAVSWRLSVRLYSRREF